MLTNRRTYYLYPEKFDAVLSLLPKMMEKTKLASGRGFRIMTSLHGQLNTIVFDIRNVDDEGRIKFDHAWHEVLIAENFVMGWFQNVKQWTNELWFFQGFEHLKEEEKSHCLDGYWNHLTQRLVFQPHSSKYRDAVGTANFIIAKTKEIFQKELLLSMCGFGTSNKIALEMDFENIEQQNHFYETWIACLKEEKLYVPFMENILEGTSEIWKTLI